MNNKKLLIILGTTIAILFIPLVAMRFTDEVNWNRFDFLVGGGLLLGTGFAIDRIIMTVKDPKKIIILVILIIAILVLVWLELAVGIFGSPLAGN